MHAERLFIIKGKSPYYMKVMREKTKNLIENGQRACKDGSQKIGKKSLNI